ncbi:MAG: AAA family ATPase [Acetatifactor sp.]
MKKLIITIENEYGSRGAEIGKLLAQKHQIPYYDRNTLDQLAMHQSYLKPSDLERIDDLFKEGLPIKLWSGPDKDILKNLYRSEETLIQAYAKKDDGVFVGGCSEYILKDLPHAIHVFIYSPMSIKLNHIMNKYGLTQDAAKTLIERMDQSRHNYYKYFTSENRGERHNKQISIDSSFLGVEKTVDLLDYMITLRQ